MKTAILLLLTIVLFLGGCTQSVEKTAGDLQGCLEKCQNVCDMIKSTDMSLDGYNQIGLTKQTGNVKLSCSCLCSC